MIAIDRRKQQVWTRRAVVLRACCILSAAVQLLASSMLAAQEKPDDRAPDAFLAARHADTAETKGHYRVGVQQLVGRQIVQGEVVYTVSTGNKAQRREGRSPLRLAGSSAHWVADIPAQPAGAIVSYHFALRTRSGESLRHPARAPGEFKFNIVPLRAVSVSLPELAGKPQKTSRAELTVEAGTRPAGELVLRLLSSTNSPIEQRVPLTVGRTSSTSPKLSVDQPRASRAALWDLQANLPQPAPGEIIDFHFALKTADGSTLQVPPNAPVLTYSIKRPLRSIQLVGGPGEFVTEVAAAGNRRWLAFHGAGLWLGETQPPRQPWQVVRRLPSASVQFMAPDPASGQTYVGTDRGIAVVDAEGNVARFVGGPSQPAPNAGSSDAAWRAGPGAVSSLDGTLFFQLQQPPVFEQAHGAALFFELRDGKLTEWRPSVALASLSAATFDEADGCWLLGGFLAGEDVLQPAVLRRCGEQVEAVALSAFSIGQTRALPQRIVALARDPNSGALVIGLEFHGADDPQRRPNYGVYRLEGMAGKLSPLAPELARLETEITALVTDWKERRTLVGTLGRGVLAVSSGVVRPLSNAERLPPEVTALSLDGSTRTLLIGTTRGAFEQTGNGFKSLRLPGGDALPADSLPMDLRRERLLLSSYRAGLVELERAPSGRWRVAQRLRPGHELPDGLYGEAKYAPNGDILAIVHSQGLLRVGPHLHTTLLRTNEGLHSPHLLQLLVRSSGEVWVAHTPIPFGDNPGGALQMLENDRVIRTIPIANRDLATISRWLEVPERGTVFAATRSGVVEIASDGAINLLAGDSASAIARESRRRALGVAGATLLRWEGERFSPVLFQVNHPRWPPGRYYPGLPIDLAIDRGGSWHLLFHGGTLAVLDPQGEVQGLLDAEDGLPSTARRLFIHPQSGELFLGGNDGLVVVGP